jgi:nitrogen fixation NifU-like protein
MYLEELMEEYREPENFGIMKNYSVKHTDWNSSCGDEIIVYLKIEKNIVENIKFQGKGCAISVVAMSRLSQKLIGKTVTKVLRVGKEEVLELLGIEINPMRLKCALLSLKAVKSAIVRFENVKN